MHSLDIAEAKAAPAPVGAPLPESTPVNEGAPPAGRRPASERLANVERLRLVAMFEIVAFHVSGALGTVNQRLPIIAGLGLPTFLLLNNAFNCTLSERMGTRAFLNVKVTRLLLPWVVWSCVYAGVVVLERLHHDEVVADGFPIWMIVGGTYDHLWFVPFALFGGLLVAWLQLKTRHLPHAPVAAAGLLLGGLIVAIDVVVLQNFAIEWPALQWLFALPSPLLGFGLGRAVLGGDRRFMVRLAVALSILAVLCVGATIVFGAHEMIERYAISIALVTLAFIRPGRADSVSQRLTPLLFGIYLMHPLIARAYQAVHLPGVPVVVLAVLVFAVAAIFVALLRRTPLQRLV